ncbi:uncharacterized protein PAF06_016931 [Gastrophryne carolinensis]
MKMCVPSAQYDCVHPYPEDGVDNAQQWCDSGELQELENKPFSLASISDFVKRNQEKLLPVTENKDVYIRICDLNGTTYMGQTHMLKSWQSLYLPRPTKMEVLGTLESACSMIPFPQWVVLVGEDRHVYLYGDEEICHVADSLKKLLQFGLDPDSQQSYAYPSHISDEELKPFQQDPEIQSIKQSADDYINGGVADYADFFEFYDS